MSNHKYAVVFYIDNNEYVLIAGKTHVKLVTDEEITYEGVVVRIDSFEQGSITIDDNDEGHVEVYCDEVIRVLKAI